ncbi:MAG TPA: response regulator [Gaiellaceae bacterium]|nr:response regulator [Gaiellaceae bacterium]
MSTRPVVLIADDDPDIRMLVRLRLERSGYEVVAASDGAEALALAGEISPDVAILDVTMPGLSGTEVTHALRARSYALPIILLTARAAETDVLLGAEAGADAYVTKPFSPQELESRVRALTHG